MPDMVSFCPNCGTPKPTANVPVAPCEPPKVPLKGAIVLALLCPLFGIPAVICCCCAKSSIEKGNFAHAKSLVSAADTLLIITDVVVIGLTIIYFCFIRQAS